MGLYFADQFSLLHYSVGVVAYFFNFSLLLAFIIHFIFEIIENSKWGIYFINHYIIDKGLFSWPGQKRKADTFINIVGDNVFFVLGWLSAYYLDLLSLKGK